MKKFLTFVAIAMLPLTALAHGPSPQKLEKEVVIKADPAKVWAIVKDFGNMQNGIRLLPAISWNRKKMKMVILRPTER